jgi:hypothetical protein
MLSTGVKPSQASLRRLRPPTSTTHDSALPWLPFLDPMPSDAARTVPHPAHNLRRWLPFASALDHRSKLRLALLFLSAVLALDRPPVTGSFLSTGRGEQLRLA